MKVQDIGPPDAKILLVGEAPGKNEESRGRPFVGAAGNMLKQLLSHSGIDYNQCRVTNVVNERPPGNDFSFFYEDKRRNTPSSRLEKKWEELRHKIETIKPNVVMPLGGEALRAITGRRYITDWRGTPMSYKSIKVIPTFHPRYIMSQYKHHPIVEIDFATVLRESESDKYKSHSIDGLIRPTKEQAIRWITAMGSVAFRLSFDIETIGRHVRCISLACVEGTIPHAICIPFIQFPSSSMTTVSPGDKVITFVGQADTTSSYWSKFDEADILGELAKLFANENIEFVGQNSISFDAPLLEDEFGIYIKNHTFDTMHAWHVLYPELPKSLSFLCSVLTNYANYWTDKDTKNDISMWSYNNWDAIVTLAISYKIEKELRDAGLLGFYKNHVHPLAFALSDASREGVLIDKKARDELIVETKKKIESVQKEVNDLADRELNPNSSTQVQKLLYGELKFPTVYKKGKPTADEEALRKLEKRYPHEEVLGKIIEYRKASKLVSTFLDVDTDDDGKMRTSYNASGTETGRPSSSKSIWGTGMNLANIPVGKGRGIANIRHIFIAREGNVLIKGDLRQAETMVVAHILRRVGDNTLYDLYRDPNFDIHRWGAKDIFGKAESEISSYERSVGKLGNHSGNYCAGPGVLQKKALKDGIEGIDYKMAQRILESRHKAIPGLRKWWRSVERKLRQTRTLTTCLGRRRIFFGRLDSSETIRSAVAFEPQSTVGDVCNTIFRRLHKSLVEDEHGVGACPILHVYDEVVVECPEIQTEYVVKAMREAAIVPLYICEDVEPLIIPLDVSIGKNWRDMKDV